ncbi:hypothetical protein EVAR_37090_1 [Eumeta japonica]|uniref:Ionotropic glutamate receptor C-terminal domain-containing protein n=1 Tax=Eumeta variegata TaxID=151549 RepID=A0A4C1XQB4_EUMVA|nr:hypothetical protein EVAR_37090_1 [Eumeta japonica]
MNVTTIAVGSLFDCTNYERMSHDSRIIRDPNERQAFVGCHVILLLQQLYNFNISYKHYNTEMSPSGAERGRLYLDLLNGTIDTYARPLSLRPEVLNYADPLMEIFKWRMGFVLRPIDLESFQSFYNRPFRRPVWGAVYATMLLAALVLYLVHGCERRLLGRPKAKCRDECTLVYQLMVVMSTSCQAGTPVFPRLTSRRIALLSYFLYAYLIYAFYTSNLLSHLVSGEDEDISVRKLADSTLDCVIVDSMKDVITGKFGTEVEYLKQKKFETVTYVNESYGLEVVRSGHAALLSDYLSLYPVIKQTFKEQEICALVEVDILNNIRKYLWTSKNYMYREQLRVGSFRLLECGLLRHATRIAEPAAPTHCIAAPAAMRLSHISYPLATLAGACLLSLLILFVEILYHRAHQIPYTD